MEKLDALQSQIPSIGVRHNASLRQRLEELESTIGRLDARSCFRAADASEESDGEAGIYERCVRSLPQFASLDAEVSNCPVCSREHLEPCRPVPTANTWKSQGLPADIQEEVQWRQQHTDLLHQKISMLERENAMWERKLQMLGRRSPGTSPQNKIVQLFPKERQQVEPDNSPPSGMSGPGHAFAMLAYEPEIAALLESPSSAREVFERMKHPRALQPLQPKLKPDMSPPRKEEEDVCDLDEAKAAAKQAEVERFQAEQRERQARRADLQQGLRDELQQMRALEDERRRRREQKRAELEDELHQQLQQEKKEWQLRQARQEMLRKERDKRRDAAHRELMLVELDRLRDKISLKQQFSTPGSQAQPTSLADNLLQELLQMRLAADGKEAHTLQDALDRSRLLTLKSFTWQDWLTSLHGYLDITPQVLHELEPVFHGGQRSLSLFDVEAACGEEGKLSKEVNASLRKWAHEEEARQVQELQMNFESWVLFYGDLLSGRSRDKEADVLVLEEAFKALAADAESTCLSFSRSCQAFESDKCSELQKQMLSNWLHAMIQKNEPTLHVDKPSKLPARVAQPATAVKESVHRASKHSEDLARPAGWSSDRVDVQPASSPACSENRNHQPEGSLRTAESTPAAAPCMDPASKAETEPSQGGQVAKFEVQPKLQEPSATEPATKQQGLSLLHPDGTVVAGTKQPLAGPGRGSGESSRGISHGAVPQPSLVSPEKRTSHTPQNGEAETLLNPGQDAARSGEAEAEGGAQADGGAKGQSLPAPSPEVPEDQGDAEAEAESGSPPDAQVGKHKATATGGQAAEAVEGQEKEDENEAEKEDSFGKEQWLDWFLSAELTSDEEQLLRAALHSLSSTRAISADSLRAALKAHEERATQEERDQLQEWSQWVSDMDED